MHPDQPIGQGQCFDIAPDRHIAHAEFDREVAHSDRAAILYRSNNELSTLVAQKLFV